MPFIVKLVKSPRVRLPLITRVSLIITLQGKIENDKEPFTVIYPFIVILEVRLLV